jgi:O-methyltransferase involved in polyketide biosynthesis
LNKANERWTFGMDPPTIGQYLQERGFVLEIDQSARKYRQTYYGKESDEMKGFEFYHVAVARVRN